MIREEGEIGEQAEQQTTEIEERIRENRLRQILRQIMNSPYMPSREQLVPITTTLVTLAIMLALGPVFGTNAALVNALVKQIVPVIVAATIKYAAEYGSPDQQQAITFEPVDSSIAQVQLQPVVVPQSTLSQTI